MADALQRITADLGVPFIFKASYDKANRTSVKSFRGPGLLEGTRILGRLARETGLPVLTDVHEPAHCEVAAEAVDVLQIPAFLCRQTDLLVAAGKTGRAINIKKGQFVAPWDMPTPSKNFAPPATSASFSPSAAPASATTIWLSIFVRLPTMRELAPVVFDGTHSVQQPSAANGVSGGQPEFIPLLARAAVAAGIDGLFLEVHDDPANAKSDGANALDLKLLKPLLRIAPRHSQSSKLTALIALTTPNPSPHGREQPDPAARPCRQSRPVFITISMFLFSQPAGICFAICSRYCGVDHKRACRFRPVRPNSRNHQHRPLRRRIVIPRHNRIVRRRGLRRVPHIKQPIVDSAHSAYPGSPRSAHQTRIGIATCS